MRLSGLERLVWILVVLLTVLLEVHIVNHDRRQAAEEQSRIQAVQELYMKTILAANRAAFEAAEKKLEACENLKMYK